MSYALFHIAVDFFIINVPRMYLSFIWRGILMRATSITRAIERGGRAALKISTFWALTWNQRSEFFFIWFLDLMVLMQANPLLGSLERVGFENLEFFGPKFRAHPFQWRL
jgi:hypothetical protein